MPALPKRSCSYAGCAQLAASGRCAKHGRIGTPSHAGKTTSERGYGKTHQYLRIQCFERDQWRCVDCGWEPELVRFFREANMGIPPTVHVLTELREAYALNARHLHADHHIPIEQRPDLAEDIDNYRTRCSVCHNRKTAREDGGFGRR